MKSTKLEELLKKELTRKQFIQVMVVGAVSLLGFQNFLNLFRQFNQPAQSSDKASSGFGNNKFGV